MISYGQYLPDVPRRFGVTLMRAAGLVVAALLSQSFFWSSANPAALKIVVAGVGALAAYKPDVALLCVAAVVPFGRVLSTLTSPAGPVGIAEPLALAYLAGWALGRLRGPVRDEPASPGLLVGYGFAAVVVASLLVDIGVLRYWKNYWQPFIGQLLSYFVRDYLNIGVEPRPWANGLGGLASANAAACVLEGLGLMRAAQTLSARNAAFGRQLLWTLAIAAVGTAVLSVRAALQLVETQGVHVLSILHVYRIAVIVTKVNTASSYFVLFLPVLMGLAAWSTRIDGHRSPAKVLRLTATAVGIVLLLMGLWLAGGRAALIAGVIVALGASLQAVSRRRTGRLHRRSAVAMLAACGVVVAVLGLGLYLKAERVEGAGALDLSFKIRLAMWSSALRVIAAHPLFGTSIGQYPYQIVAFVPDGAARAYIGNAHNQFLEVAAELGVIGGVLFVGMFAAILWRAWKAFRTSRDPALGGAIAGVVAFLITCLAGQPLLYNLVAFPFWMVLGVLFAGGDMAAETAHARPTPASRRLWRRAIAGFMIVLAMSIPVRVWQGRDGVNFALAKYGFSGWHEPSDGRHYRLVRGDGTFFTYPHARWLKLPIRRDVEAGRSLLDVDVSLDGRRARTLTLADDEWQTVEFMIPADANRRFRRIDLAVRAPAGVPAQVRVAPAEITEDEAVEKGRSR
jgi:O-antigen ligase